jgi:hypothetical protein
MNKWLGVKSYIRCGSVVVVLAIAREARKHRPEICFPAAGYQPCGDDGIYDGRRERVLNSFRCVWILRIEETKNMCSSAFGKKG